MLYDVGDYVFPVDLPRRVVCRVDAVDRVAIQGGEMIQILTLAPLGGPWRPGTQLIRLDGAVAPVDERLRRPRVSQRALRERLRGTEQWAGEPVDSKVDRAVRLRVCGLRLGTGPETSDG
ncbi:MAG TPA: hypothetical protein VNO26_16405 [Candidatus Limnocylindria bacterium]|nr:hypothetical protein [Candidatus Limnocylindria bacterium]